MLQVKTRGFILDKVAGYGDEGKISIFTSKFGILRVVASGLYRSGAKLAGWSEPPSLVMADFVLPEDSINGRLFTLSPIKLFPKLRAKHSNVSWYYFYLFLLNNFLPAGIKSPFLFKLWEETLKSITSDGFKGRNLGLVYFVTRMLRNQGVYPGFKHCISCEKRWEKEETAYFTFDEQGLVCSQCLKKYQNNYPQDDRFRDYSLEYIRLLPFKKTLVFPQGFLRILAPERKILEICEKSESFDQAFANINSYHMINDLCVKKARNFMLLFLAPLLQ